MIRRPTKATDPDDYVGKFILCDSPFEGRLVGELRYVSKASGSRLYVIRPLKDGTVEGPDSPEGHIASKRVRLICDTWAEAKECLSLNDEAEQAYKAAMKQWTDARRGLTERLFAMCAIPSPTTEQEQSHG